MSPTVLFLLLLIVSFGVALFFLRPSRTETDIQHQLEGISKDRESGLAGGGILKEEGVVLSPWVAELFRRTPGSAALSRLIEQAGSRWPSPYVLLVVVLATPVAIWLATFWIPALPLDLMAGTGVGLLPVAYLYILREIRFMRCDRVFPEAVDLMARALRAGHSIQAAMEMVGQEVGEPVGSEFRRVCKEMTLGLPMREALGYLVTRLPRDDVRFFSTAILVQKETGGNLVRILDKASEVMRERARLRGQVNIYSAQGRLTGVILCAMPFVMFLLLSLVNRNYERVLYEDPLGIKLIEVGAVMMVLGVIVIRKIVDIKV